MKAAPPPLRVGSPCPKQWEGMHGDAKRRFCEQCQLHVHDLSAMSLRERESFVREHADGACITYELRADGTMVTRSLWRALLRPFRRLQVAAVAVLAAVLPFWFTACASRRTTGVPMPPPSVDQKTLRLADRGRVVGEAPPIGRQVEKSGSTLRGRALVPKSLTE